MVNPFWESETGAELSLYFHLPFCTRKCHYCHFYVIPDKPQFKDKLLQGLEWEWQLRLPELSRCSLYSLYFGGGTPYLFGPDRLAPIILWAKRLGLGADAEITLEANPEDLTLSTAVQYGKAGVNRFSLGVQSFHPEHLKELNRLHSVEKAIEAVYCVKNSGIDNISIDLMYDLPSQTLAQWQKTLDIAISLPITHISIYNLTIEPHTVFYKYRSTLAEKMPNPEISSEMYHIAQQKLSQAGFEQYEISAFAKPPYSARHNSGYWTGRSFLGFGPSAYSYFEGLRFADIPNLNRYVKFLEQGKLPITVIDELEEKARVRELLAIHLRLLAGVNMQKFEGRYGPLEPAVRKGIETLCLNGLLEYSSGRLRLTKKGILFYDTVAVEIC